MTHRRPIWQQKNAILGDQSYSFCWQLLDMPSAWGVPSYLQHFILHHNIRLQTHPPTYMHFRIPEPTMTCTLSTHAFPLRPRQNTAPIAHYTHCRRCPATVFPRSSVRQVEVAPLVSESPTLWLFPFVGRHSSPNPCRQRFIPIMTARTANLPCAIF